MSRKVVFVGEAYGEQEDKLKMGFVGTSGVELFRMLRDAGFIQLTPYDYERIEEWWRYRDPTQVALLWEEHPELYRTNVFNLRPAGNKIETLCGNKKEGAPGWPLLKQGKYVLPQYIGELTRLREELEHEQPNLVVALGATASWALVSDSRITKIRGAVAPSTLVPGMKVLPTFHPAAVLYQWNNRHVTVVDLSKAKREQEFPDIRRPKREVYTEPSLSDLEWFYDNYLREAERISFDIETASSQITCIGFAPTIDRCLVIPFVDTRRNGGSYWTTPEEEKQAWEFVRRVLDHPAPKVAQNGLYDIHFLWRGYGITVRNFEEDTMLLHHALQPESPKGLDFLGSVYTDEAAWKLMRRQKGRGTLKRDD